VSAQFIAPIIARTLEVLRKYTPAALANCEPFVDFGKQPSDIVQNWPSVYVMPVRTMFDADAQNMRRQAHLIKITMAVSAPEPDLVTDAAMAYMAAVDAAIAQSDPGDWVGILAAGTVLRVFVQTHDYGPLFQHGGMLARFPEMNLIVETEEL
jgi:hypothetical protein